MMFEWVATDEEIRAWMDKEIERLGGWFRNFTITWHRNEERHWLEIWSESKAKLSRSGELYGKCYCIGEVLCDEDWIALPFIQSEGRKLYYRLKKDYKVVRELGCR